MNAFDPLVSEARNSFALSLSLFVFLAIFCSQAIVESSGRGFAGEGQVPVSDRGGWRRSEREQPRKLVCLISLLRLSHLG